MFLIFKTWVEVNLNTVLVLSLIVGMFSPWVSWIPDQVVFLLLGTMIYFSCARMSMDDLAHIEPRLAILFYCVRFLLVPFVIFGVASITFPEFRETALLLALIPSGATSGAVTGLFGGSVVAALGYTVISNVLAPFTVSGAFALIGYPGVNIDVLGILYSLCAVIFLPVALYFGISNRVSRIKAWTSEYSRFFTVLLLFVLLVLVVGKQRDFIIAQPLLLLKVIPLFSLLFVIFYLIGWFFPANGHFGTRIAQTICSGMNNLSLSIGIALLYFPAVVSLILVVMHIPWILGLVFFKRYLARIEQ